MGFAIGLAAAAVATLVVAVSLHISPPVALPDSSRGQILWVPVVVDASGTRGTTPRTLRQVNPKEVKKVLETIPQKDLGQIVFNPPRYMTVGLEEPIEAAITLGDVEAAIRQFVGKGIVTKANLTVSSRMRVKILGEDFKIKEYSSEEQTVDIGKPSFEPTLWKWRITALKSGQLPLTLRATRIMAVPRGGDVPRDLPSFEYRIIVTANRWYSIEHWTSDNRTWAIPLAVSPAVPAFGKAFHWLKFGMNRRKRKRVSRRRSVKRFGRYDGS